MDLKKKGYFAGCLLRTLALSTAIGFFSASVSAETVKVSLADSVQMALANNRTIKEFLRMWILRMRRCIRRIAAWDRT